MMNEVKDPALQPPTIITSPGPEYADDRRFWQGIPGIEHAANGRLWALWYSGGKTEEPGNYVLAVTSDDDGATWSGPRFVVQPQPILRAYDPTLWHDPMGRMWLFWAQCEGNYDGRAGVWAIMTEDSGSAYPTWTEPVRICNGVMMNKPTVLSTGEWLLPTAVWAEQKGNTYDLGKEKGANVTCSVDNGSAWSLLGQANVERVSFEEHMIIERRDSSLWMLIRTQRGIAESISTDRGRTWSDGALTSLSSVDSRFFIRRLKSGRLLLVANMPPSGAARSHLTACLSDDDGVSWYGGLVLDEREATSYPDGIEAPDGTIRIIYDFNRYSDRQIFMARFVEDDVTRGEPGSAGSCTRMLVNQATGPLPS